MLCMTSALVISFSACGDKSGKNVFSDESQTIASVSETFQSQDKTVEKEQQTIPAEDTSETPKGYEMPSEIPMIGGSDTAFMRKYIEKAENAYIAYLIVGDEEYENWLNNVYLMKSSEERNEFPELYQIIHELNISKEDFVAQNNEFVDYPDMYYSEEIISALYSDDVEEMKKQLINPLALYYDGEIYTFDELSQSKNARVAANIPADVMNNYLGYIELVCEENGIIKYMQEDIDRVQNTYQLAVGQDEINSESEVTDWENDVTDFDNTETDFEENEVTDFEENTTDIIDDEIPFATDEN